MKKIIFGLILIPCISFADDIRPSGGSSAAAGGGGGSSTLAIATGTPTQLGSPAGTFISSPTAIINFDKNSFVIPLQGSATAYVQIGAGGVSTFTPTGMVFFISSNTIAGSSFTASASFSNFSTYTVLANTLTLGHDIKVECAFQNSGTALSGANAGIAATNIAAGTPHLLEFTGTASDWIRVDGWYNLVQSKMVDIFGEGLHINGNSAGGNVNVATNGLGGTSIGVGLDNTVAQTFNCSAALTSGGTIDFMYMKVYIE